MSFEIEARAVRAGLVNDGYVVFRGAVPVVLCEAVLEAIGTELGIWVGDPRSWDRVSSQIEEVPLRGHQSQWVIRQLPDLYAIWSTVWGTERLWVDRNACRFTPPWNEARGAAAAPLGRRSSRPRCALVSGNPGPHGHAGGCRGVPMCAFGHAQPGSLAGHMAEIPPWCGVSARGRCR